MNVRKTRLRFQSIRPFNAYLSENLKDESGQQALLAAERIAKFEVLTDEDRANLAYWSDILTSIQ